MFFKNRFRPVFAGVTKVDNSSFADKKCINATFDASQRNDFEAFSTHSSANGYHAPRTPRRKKVTFEFPGRVIATMLGFVVGFLLLIALLISLLSSGKSAIFYEDNAFASFVDVDGKYRIVMNGKVLDDKFENEVTLTEARDNSFAYVTTVVDDATNVYTLDSGKLKLVCEKVDKVLALCDYKPGVIYKYGDKIEYCYNGLLTTLSKKNAALPENFVISPDGTAVAYTIKNDSSVKDLYVYTEKMAMPEARNKGNVTTIPVSISDNGDFVVAYTEKENNRDLYLIKGTDHYKINNVSGSYHSIVSANADASEIVFTTKQDKDYRTYVYNCKNVKKDVTFAYLVSNGYAVPDMIDETICATKTFKKSYFKDITSPLTIYVNKKYERHEIYNYLGQIDPDQRYLYVIVEHKDNTLAQVELPGEKAGDTISKVSSIATGVTDFIITQKGNIYYVDEYDELYYYKLTKGKPTRITSDISDLVFYSYANDLYFEKEDAVDTNGVYITSEGSDHKKFKLSKIELTSTPEMTNTYSKKSYAYLHDEDTDKDILFYTSNGRSFKKVAECNKIISVHKDPLKELTKDLVS